ncbi:copper ion binding protein [Alkalibacter mobilis]|uniref:copper ion binding protein n=1 Tax=Alkalibacter mobilis TaxID=2787712 RepID=UPI00189C76C6|nr:heavy-metal-associated domain-containing protein [Alkalibacter mobilis]
MNKTVIKVEGMSCSHCVNSVETAVGAIDGVSGVAVDLEGKTVTVDHDSSVTLDNLKDAIEGQGYDVVD